MPHLQNKVNSTTSKVKKIREFSDKVKNTRILLRQGKHYYYYKVKENAITQQFSVCQESVSKKIAEIFVFGCQKIRNVDGSTDEKEARMVGLDGSRYVFSRSTLTNPTTFPCTIFFFFLKSSILSRKRRFFLFKRCSIC